MQKKSGTVDKRTESENLKIRQELNYDQYEISEGVRMRMFDEEGLPYDPERAAREMKEAEEDQGEIVFELNVGVKPGTRVTRHMDFEEWEMTPDQREVFQALECEEEGLYDELEDDFVINANAGVIPMRKKPLPGADYLIWSKYINSGNEISPVITEFQNFEYL